MGANQYTAKGAPKRDSPIPVRLTREEHKRAKDLALKYGATVADILRSGLKSFEREHLRLAERRCKWCSETDGAIVEIAGDYWHNPCYTVACQRAALPRTRP